MEPYGIQSGPTPITYAHAHIARYGFLQFLKDTLIILAAYVGGRARGPEEFCSQGCKYVL
jgi:hypothetical protein